LKEITYIITKPIEFSEIKNWFFQELEVDVMQKVNDQYSQITDGKL
jgi:hypothetical protein